MTTNADKPAKPPLSKKKVLAFRCLAVGIPTVIGAVLIGALLLRPQPVYFVEPTVEGQLPTEHKFQYHELLGWANVPGYQSKTYGKDYTINSHGMRGDEYATEKPAGVKRMLVLGDSFGWGYGVGDQEVFTEIMEDHLAESSTQRWEILNSSVIAYGTDQQYLYMVTEGFNYSPDVVLLAFFILNDPINSVTSGTYQQHKPVFLNLELTELHWVPPPLPTSGATNIVVNIDPIEMAISLMKKIASECQQHNSKLVVMKFGGFIDTGPDIPWYPDGTRPYVDIENHFHREFQEHLQVQDHVYYLDLDKQYADAGLTEETLYSDETSHWSVEGHRATEEILFKFLADQALISTESD